MTYSIRNSASNRRTFLASALVALMTLQAFLVLFTIVPVASAASIPSSIGEWTISSDVSYDGGSAVVTGNITIQNGGKLTLQGLTLSMNGPSADALTIRVAQGGSLFVYDSTIQAVNDLESYQFVFEDGSTGLIVNSTIQNVGSHVSMAGITVLKTASVTMRSTTITKSFQALFADGSTPTLDGCFIRGGQGPYEGPYAVLVTNNARPVIINTIVTLFTSGTGIFIYNADAELRSDTISYNKIGIGMHSSQALLAKTTITANFETGLSSESSAPDLVQSSVSNNNGDGIVAKTSSMVLDRTTIKENGGNGLVITQSTVNLRDSKVYGSGLKDISMTGVVNGQPSKAMLQNTTYGTLEIPDQTPLTSLESYWSVSVKAIYQSDGSAVPDATVWLSDNQGSVVLKSQTDRNGALGPSTVLSFTVDHAGKAEKTPHMLTVQKGQEKQTADINLTSSGSDITLTFDDIRPWINLDPFTTITNEASVNLGGLVAPDTAQVLVNGNSQKLDLLAHRFSGAAVLTPGVNELVIEAVDHVGNVNNTTVQVTMDIVPPVLELTLPKIVDDLPIYTNIGYLTISGRTEPAATLWVDDGLVGQSASGLFETLVGLTSGSNTIVIRAQDLAGNQATRTIVVFYDPDGPVLQLMEPRILSTNQPYQVVSGTVNDPEAKVVVTINGVDTRVALDGLAFKLTIHLMEGTNQLSVKATDKAGNIVVATKTLILDTIPPQLVVDIPEDGFLTNSKSILVAGMTDEDSMLTVDGSGASRDGLNFSATVTLAEGKNVIEVAAHDAAGNERTVRVNVLCDPIAPVIVIISPKAGSTILGRTADVEGYLSEPSGLTLDGHALSVDPQGQTFKATVELNEGRNVLTFNARDKAGNLGAITLIINRDSAVTLDNVYFERIGKDRYIVSGRTDPDASLNINGKAYSVEPTGFFRVVVNTKDGSKIDVTATDPMGNLKSAQMTTPQGHAGTVAFNWGPAILVLSFGTVVMVVGLVGGTERGRLLALFYLFVPLYSRMKKNTVLDHYVRGQIHGYIVANPGDHYNSIKEALKLNNGTLAYHIRVLEREGIIKSRNDGIYKRFYPADMKVPENDGTRLTEIQKIILKRIKETPGISQKEMSRLVGVSPSTINYHIDILKSAGLVKSERRGMSIGYFLEDIIALKDAEKLSMDRKRTSVLDEDHRFNKDLAHHDFTAHDESQMQAAPGTVKRVVKKVVRASTYEPRPDDEEDDGF
jgi:DNA-binding transcriptional ArsR family regulator